MLNGETLNGVTLNGPEYLVVSVSPSAGMLVFGASQPDVVLYRMPIVDPAAGLLTFGSEQPWVVRYLLPTVNPAAAHLAFFGGQPEVWFDALAASPGLSPEVDYESWIYLVEVGAVTGLADIPGAVINGFDLNGAALNGDVGGGVTVETLRYTDSSMGYATRPNEAPGNAQYDPSLQQPGYVQRDITVGAAQTSFGEVILASTGHLDGLLDYGLDGQQILIRRGPQDGVYPDDFPLRLVATLEQPEFAATTVRLKMRDRMALFGDPLQTARYGGSNVLPAGIDGGEDLKGNPKPLIYGRVFNVAPAPVNTSRLIYQANDGALTDLPAVYDRGAALSRGADYVSEADMQATAPAAGQYRAWLAGGCFRLGGAPTGQVTCDALEGAMLADRYAGALLVRIAGRMGVTNIDMVDAYALDAAAPYELGIVVDAQESAASVMARVAASVGAWFGFDRLDYLRIGRLATPTGTPVVEITDLSITSIERTSQADVPVWRVALSYDRNATDQATDLAGSVSAERRAWLAQTWRTAVAANPSVKLQHRLSGELLRDSAIVWPADATAESARLLALHSQRRDTFLVGARLSGGEADLLDLGDVVRVTWPRYGMDDGRLFVVIGMRLDFGGDAVDLTLWG